MTQKPRLLNPYTTDYVNPEQSVEETPVEKTPECPPVPYYHDLAAIRIAIVSFADECSAMVAKDFERFTNLIAAGSLRRVRIEFGRRYAKLVTVDMCNGRLVSKSVYCFVDMTNGDILKAASLYAPAKHSRGNVLKADRMKSMTAYGAIYLR